MAGRTKRSDVGCRYPVPDTLKTAGLCRIVRPWWKIPSQSRTLHKPKHADLARYLLHPSHDVRCAGGGPCPALLIDPPHSFPVAREHTRARHQLVEARNQLGEGVLNRPRGRCVCSRRLCPTVASTTSRSASSGLIPANHQSISATGIIHLTSLFSQLDRHEEDQTGRNGQKKKKASK